MCKIDLTNWVVHFIHDKQPKNTPSFIDPDTNGVYDFPECFDEDGKPICIFDWLEDEENYPIEHNAKAFDVLKKILYDGYIRSSWSFRNGNATILGPRSAVCFTEMPLYTLVDYAKNQGHCFGNVSNYAIMLRVDELFKAGARPVIYGLSAPHIELEDTDRIIMQRKYALRLLPSVETGLLPIEQYRYVYLNINKQIDCIHEREWRWPIGEHDDVAGLPFLLKDDSIVNFKNAMILVSTESEKDEILSQLKNIFDSGATSVGRGYNVTLVKKINVISIESLRKLKIDIKKIRLKDIPMAKIKKIVAKPETLAKVRKAWDEACDIALNASEKFYKEQLNSIDRGGCGYSNVTTSEESEITQALLDLEIARSYSPYRGCVLYGLKQLRVQNIDVHEAGAKAAAEYLTKELGQEFYVDSRLD